MSPTPRRPRHRAAAFACSTLALGATGLVAATAAHAANESISCAATAGNGCRDGARHSLSSVYSYSGSNSVYSGAAGSVSGNPSDPYGKWYTGAPSACRVYGGGTVLYPLLMNVDGGGKRTIFGTSTWGTGPGC